MPPTCLPAPPARFTSATSFSTWSRILGLTILLEVALGGRLRAHAWVTILIVLSYGAIDEALQPLVGRTADLLDWLADAAGAAIGICICGAVAFRFFGHRTSSRSSGRA